MRVFEVTWPGPARLAVVSRPSGESLDVELTALRTTGFGTLVSLLSAPEVIELGLEGEPGAAERAGLRFRSLPVRDYSTPDGDQFRAALFEIHDRYRAGEHVAAHCRGSVGRAPLLVASLMVLDGGAVEDIWRRLAEARGCPVPDTDAQRSWIRTLSLRA